MVLFSRRQAAWTALPFARSRDCISGLRGMTCRAFVSKMSSVPLPEASISPFSSMAK